MKSRYAQQIRTCVNEWFKEHTAQFFDVGGDITHPSSAAPRLYQLRWKKPGTVIFWTDYIISGHYLLVYGDAGDAVYAWSENLTWEFLKGTDLEYFAGKCQASEVGRDFNQWDPRRMHDEIRHYLLEQQYNLESCSELLEVCSEAASSNDWCRMVDERDLWQPLGSDWVEMAGWGETINVRCIGHWVGIQMATGNTEAMLKRYEV